MQAIIWKELRENFKWAILALVALGFGEFYVLSTDSLTYIQSYTGFTMISTQFLLVTSFGCPIFGAGLGAIQIIPELRRDQWASLVHRPVQREIIFYGKVVAGLVLYLASTLLPLLACYFYISIPGLFPCPAVPEMLIPAFSDLVLGLAFYALALFLCLHRGRWPIQLLLILSTIPVCVLHGGSAGLFLIPLTATVFYFLAAQGAIHSNGSLTNRPPLGRATFITILLTGVVMVITLLTLIGDAWPLAKQKSYPYKEFLISREGHVFILENDAMSQNPHLSEVNGQPVTDPQYLGANQNRNLRGSVYLAALLSLIKSNYVDDFLSQRPRQCDQYVPLIERYNGSKENWFFLIQAKYFIGYDKLSRRCIGVCDSDGFKPAGAALKPFAKVVQLNWEGGINNLGWIDSQLMEFDFASRKMTLILDSGTEEIRTAEYIRENWNNQVSTQFLVFLPQEIRFFQSAERPPLTIPYPRDPQRWNIFGIVKSKDPEHLFLNSSSFDDRSAPLFLDEIDQQGRVLQTYSFTPPEQIVEPTTLLDWISVSFVPLYQVVVGKIYQIYLPITAHSLQGEHPLGYFFWNYDWAKTDRVLIVSLILSGLTWFWSRKVGFSFTKGRNWAIFVFIFGLPGLIVFRLAANFPTTVNCPACSHPRPIEQPDCPSCHQPWPALPPTGTEIIDGGDVR